MGKEKRFCRILMNDSRAVSYTHLEAARSTEENVFIKTKEEKHTLLRKEIFTQLYQKNPRWWQAVVLAYIYEVPQEDIAVKMRIELNALYQMLYRARKWITKNYREEFEKLI